MRHFSHLDPFKNSLLTKDLLEKMLYKLGRKKFGVHEVFLRSSKEIDSSKIKAVIFCTKWTPPDTFALPIEGQNETSKTLNEKIYFAGQVDPNSTILMTSINFLLNILSNNGATPTTTISAPDNLINDIVSVTQHMNSKLKGLCIYNSKLLLNLYNDTIANCIEKSPNNDDDDDDENDQWYRMSLFMNKYDSLFELDGFYDDIIFHDNNNQKKEWQQCVFDIIEERIIKCEFEEIDYKIWVIVEDHSTAESLTHDTNSLLMDTPTENKQELEQFFKQFLEKICKNNESS